MSLANDLHQEPRRSFLKVVTGILGGMLGAVTALPGLALLLHPAARETVRGGRQPLRVASLRELKPGKPLRVDVRGELVDAWSRMPDVKLGSCWLVREPGGDPDQVPTRYRTGDGADQVRAFSTVCPHLGCQHRAGREPAALRLPLPRLVLSTRRAGAGRSVAPGHGRAGSGPRGRGREGGLPPLPGRQHQQGGGVSAPAGHGLATAHRTRHGAMARPRWPMSTTAPGWSSAWHALMRHPIPGGAAWFHALGSHRHLPAGGGVRDRAVPGVLLRALGPHRLGVGGVHPGRADRRAGSCAGCTASAHRR